jgi:hypothetical protein
MEWL